MGSNTEIQIINVFVSYENKQCFARISELPGFVIIKRDLGEIIKIIDVVLSNYLNFMEKAGILVPEIFKSNYKFSYKLTVSSLVSHYIDKISLTKLTDIVGIERNQLSGYASKKHQPKEELSQRIITSLHKLGEELLSIQIAKDNECDDYDVNLNRIFELETKITK